MKIALVGSKAIGLGAYRALQQYANVRAVTLDDSRDTRSRLADFRELGATVVSKEEANRVIDDLDADLIVVAGWYWRIERTAGRRIVGIHHSLLPRYRGGSPLVWALIRGERRVGTSLFTLTDEMDAGPIWAQAELDVRDGYVGDVMERCDRAAIRLLPELLHVEPVEQDHSQATWCAQRKPSDGLIDWTRPAEEVVRWIRAQSAPYPGAFTYCDGQPVSIWRASLARPVLGTPGQVVDGVVVCGEGAIVVEESSHRLHGRLGQLTYGRVA